MVIKYEMSKLVKLVDSYTGKAIEKGKILLFEKNRFMDKGDGFYVATNLSEGLYDAKVEAVGYFTKQVDILVSASESVLLVMLTPNRKIDILQVPLMLCNLEQTLHKVDIFYTADVVDLKRIITSRVLPGDREIKLQNDIFLSLEGRKIGFQSGRICQLGELSYLSGKYLMREEVGEEIPMGATCNLLLEAQSDVNGLAILEIPSYMVQNEEFELKIYINKSFYKYTLCKSDYVNLLRDKNIDYSDKILKIEIGSDE